MATMLRRITLVLAWCLVTSSTLVYSLSYYQKATVNSRAISLLPQELAVPLTPPKLLYAALPSPLEGIQINIGTADARPEIIRQYLKKYDSPLYPYADLIVQMADQYGFDYRWLVAIAQQESNLCRHIPEGSYNCWGWGIYGDKVTRFASYDDAIRKISPQFKKIFIASHTTKPDQVMKTYTPPSDGSWAFGVNQFMQELE